MRAFHVTAALALTILGGLTGPGGTAFAQTDTQLKDTQTADTQTKSATDTQDKSAHHVVPRHRHPARPAVSAAPAASAAPAVSAEPTASAPPAAKAARTVAATQETTTSPNSQKNTYPTE